MVLLKICGTRVQYSSNMPRVHPPPRGFGVSQVANLPLDGLGMGSCLLFPSFSSIIKPLKILPPIREIWAQGGTGAT
jgi:hypothetical protein